MMWARKLGVLALAAGSLAAPLGLYILLGGGTVCGRGCGAFTQGVEVPMGSIAVALGTAMLLGGAIAIRLPPRPELPNEKPAK